MTNENTAEPDEAGITHGESTAGSESGNRPALGVARFLPPRAAEMLVQAVGRAQQFPDSSFHRRKEIDDAITRVRLQFPGYFRDLRRK